MAERGEGTVTPFTEETLDGLKPKESDVLYQMGMSTETVLVKAILGDLVRIPKKDSREYPKAIRSLIRKGLLIEGEDEGRSENLITKARCQ